MLTPPSSLKSNDGVPTQHCPVCPVNQRLLFFQCLSSNLVAGADLALVFMRGFLGVLVVVYRTCRTEVLPKPSCCWFMPSLRAGTWRRRIFSLWPSFPRRVEPLNTVPEKTYTVPVPPSLSTFQRYSSHADRVFFSASPLCPLSPLLQSHSVLLL